MTTDQDRTMARQCAHLFGGNGKSEKEQIELVAAELAAWREAQCGKLREALAPFAAIRDTVPLYVIPNLPDCNITATLKAEVWQRAKDTFAA